MNRSRRGAAKISVVWMIAVIVMFLVSFAMAVAAFQDRSDAIALRDAAAGREQVELERAQEASAKHTGLSQLVGWFDKDAATPDAKLDQLSASLDEFKTSFDLGDNVKTLEDVLPEVRAAFLRLNQEINTHKQSIDALDGEKTALQTQMRDSLRAKDDEIAGLRSQLSDAQTAAADKQSELEDRIAALRTRNNELDEEALRAAADADVALREKDAEAQTMVTRLNSQADKLNPIVKAPETPDGEVLAVGKNIAWINLGARQRLTTGTRFRVIDGSAASSRVKAWATVTDEVEGDMAEVLLTDVVDRFDPVNPGDVVYNPLYDPKGERFAVLGGRFSGKFNQAELTELLREMNITVQKALDVNTDFLIVGSELYVDPETQEPLEEPLPASELPVYKDAQAQGGITILPIKDLRAYFTF